VAPAAPPELRIEDVRLGILYMVASVFLFSIQNAIGKWLAQTYPIPMLVFFRSAVALLPSFLLVLRAGGISVLRTNRLGAQFSRAVIWVEIAGRKFVPGQGNNVYIFPAMGMAVFATEATRVTEEMFIVAAKAVAEQVTDEDLSVGLIYPPQSRILEASLHVAERVAAYIFDKGLARVPRPDDIGALIRTRAYRPVYPE
jgi:hypothetical protein